MTEATKIPAPSAEECRALVEERQRRRASGTRRRCWGLSSDALERLAIHGIPPNRAPLDPSDLLACYRTFDMATLSLKARMADQLQAWTDEVSQRYSLMDMFHVLAIEREMQREIDECRGAA